MLHPLLQVIAGGHYDLDCFVTDPLGNVLYNEVKKQYDSFSHTTTMSGVYKVCFSNEFSTLSSKTVYLEFRHGNEKPLLQSMVGTTALTQVGLGSLILEHVPVVVHLLAVAAIRSLQCCQDFFFCLVLNLTLVVRTIENKTKLLKFKVLL